VVRQAQEWKNLSEPEYWESQLSIDYPQTASNRLRPATTYLLNAFEKSRADGARPNDGVASHSP